MHPSGAGSHILDEETFRYLLGIEQTRAERSRRPFVVLLVDVTEAPAESVRIDPAVAGPLFTALARSVRDTDVVGWYRGGRVAGAMLTELGEGSLADVARLVGERVTERLHGQLASAVLDRVRVRVFRYPELETDPGGRARPVSWVGEGRRPRPDRAVSPIRRALDSAAGVVAPLAGGLASLVRSGGQFAVPRERNA